jgi:hypothetical protein
MLLYPDAVNRMTIEAIETWGINPDCGLIHTSSGDCSVYLCCRDIVVQFHGWNRVVQRSRVNRQKECSVCFDPLSDSDKNRREILTFVNCGHNMCTACFYKWDDRTCPICRDKVKMEPFKVFMPIKAARQLFNIPCISSRIYRDIQRTTEV